ncbi:hypothetical protein HK096_005760, partial [Nowakowskiella sp. JEL0078]
MDKAESVNRKYTADSLVSENIVKANDSDFSYPPTFTKDRDYRLNDFMRKGRRLPSALPENIDFQHRVITNSEKNMSIQSSVIKKNLDKNGIEMSKSVSTSFLQNNSRENQVEQIVVDVNTFQKPKSIQVHSPSQISLINDQVVSPSRSFPEGFSNARVLGRRRSIGAIKEFTHRAVVGKFKVSEESKAPSLYTSEILPNYQENCNQTSNKQISPKSESHDTKKPTVSTSKNPIPSIILTDNAQSSSTPENTPDPPKTPTTDEVEYLSLQSTTGTFSPPHRRSTGELFNCIGHYRILRTVGTGAFSQVKLAIDIHNEKTVALKMISKIMLESSARMQLSVSREIELMHVKYCFIVRS